MTPILLAGAILAACQSQAAPTEIPLPTIAATPRSTPLPAIATSVPVGTEDNPVRIVLVPYNPAEAEDAVEVIETAIREKSGVHVQVWLVQRSAEALSALCESPGGPPTAAWLDGLTAAAARAQGCGDVDLVAEQTSGRLQVANIIVPAESAITDVAELNGADFCRLSATDVASWLLPSVIMQVRNVRPMRELGAIRDYDSSDALLEAVANGECESAGVAAAALAAADTQLRDNIAVIGSLELPYAVLVYPQAVNLSQREWLNEALVSISTDEALAPALRALIGQEALRAARSDDFESLDDALRAAEIDLAQLADP